MQLSDKTILVTGSTDGVGRLVATRLAEAGARVFVHGRSRERGEELVSEVAAAGGSAQFFRADFASLDEVRALAAAVQGATGRLDILVNNAGIGFGLRGAQRELSRDGYELRFAVNYLAPFLLTRLLLPLLGASAPARIVNVASLGQHRLDFDDLMLERDYDGRRAYRQSKLAEIMFTFDLARELAGSGVTVNALHPATFMNTAMVRESGQAPWSTVDQGAEAILELAVSSKLDGRTGLFFDGLREARADAQAYDERARGELRAQSERLVGLAA